MTGPVPCLPMVRAYDQDALMALVDEFWPPPPSGQRTNGRPRSSRLPIVCVILRICDPDHGVVHNLSEELVRLGQDQEYREQCGFANGRVPSRSVFVKAYQVMRENWPRFRACMVSDAARPGDGDGHKIADAVLQHLGWDGNLPPQFRVEGKDQSLSAPTRLNGDARHKSSELLPAPVVDSVSANGKDSGEPVLHRVYPRNWHLYNQAQMHEGQDFLALLGGVADLANLEEARSLPAVVRGRPRCPLGAVVFSLLCKAYYGLSARRLHSQLDNAVRLGYLRALPSGLLGAHAATASSSSSESMYAWIPQFNTVNYYIRSSWLTRILIELITVSAMPLRGVETDFAVDGTGWSSHLFARWLDHRSESEARRHGWVKLHLITGVRTNIVTAAVVSPSAHHDNVYFPGLVSKTARHFRVRQVTADMAYSSHANYELVRQLGAELFVPFKSNTVPARADGSAWSEAWQVFNDQLDKFNDEYHRRSNVESTNSSLKRKFPAQLRSKSFQGQFNELLCKLVAYNLVAVAREVRMLGIVPDFPSEVGLLKGSIQAFSEAPRREAA